MKNWLDKYNDNIPKAQGGEWIKRAPAEFVPPPALTNHEENFFREEAAQNITDKWFPQLEENRLYGGNKNLKIIDNRKQMLTTGEPLRPNSDLVGGTYKRKQLDDLIEEAKRQNMSKEDILNLVTMGFQETKWGKTDANIGHVLGDWEGNSFHQKFISAYKGKMKEADRLKITDPIMRLQVYNGLGTVTPKTEKNYHKFEMQKIYGVPIPKKGISMKKNPLYGKQITDLRDNVLMKNPNFTKYLDSIYSSPVVSNDITPKQQLVINGMPAFQNGGGIKKRFLQPTDDYLPSTFNKETGESNSEISMSVGGENGEPAYMIPSFKYGRHLENPLEEFQKTGEHLGGPFKSWQDAEEFGKLRHGYVERGENIPMPIPTSNMQNGGVIKDDRGQWEHPGEITEIGSNQITMQGVPYPVLGISDTGDKQMMYPGQDYEYEGSKVTEYPMAKKGKTVKPKKKVLVFAEAPIKERKTYKGSDKNLPANMKAIWEAYKNADNELEAIYDERTNSPYYKAIEGHESRVLGEANALWNKRDKSGLTKEEEIKLEQLIATLDSLRTNSSGDYERNWEDKLYDAREKRNNFQSAFDNPLLNPVIKYRQGTFAKEANNVKAFYEKQGNNVDVEVVPMYEQQQLLQDKLSGLNEGDDVAVFGHHGNNLLGIPNDSIAKYVGKSKASNCYLGTCYSEDIIEPYKQNLKGKTINYRPNTQWLGFNPDAKTFDEGMWSRNYTKMDEEIETGGIPTLNPKVISLKKGVTHKKIQLQDGGELQKLDQLTNFTNYNKPQPGGWLNKYSR